MIVVHGVYEIHSAAAVFLVDIHLKSNEVNTLMEHPSGVSVRSYTSRLHNAYGLMAPLAWFSSLLRDRGGRNDTTAI
jgi:hypothetical protein